MKQGWEIRKLGEVFNLQMGKTPSRDNSDYWGGTNTWVAISDLQGKFIGTSKEHITDKAIADSKIKKVKAGTVIMSFKLSVGRAAITTEDLYTNEAIMAFNLNDAYELKSDYIYYYLKGYKWEGANKAVMGITLNKATISQNYIAIPPLPVQEQIVSELDLLSGIIEKKREQLKELDALAQSIFYDMFGDPITNEKGWEVLPLKQASQLKAGKAIKANELSDISNTGLYPCFGGNGIRGYINKKSHNGQHPIIGRQGALCGNVVMAQGEFYATEHAVVCNDIIDSIKPIWLYFALKHNNLNRFAQGVAQPGLSVNIINEMPLILPPLPLQHQFASKIEAIERQKELIKQSISETETLFNERMQHYFS